MLSCGGKGSRSIDDADASSSAVTNTGSETATDADSVTDKDTAGDTGSDTAGDTGSDNAGDSGSCTGSGTDRDTDVDTVGMKLSGWLVPGAAYSAGGTKTLRGAVAPSYKA